MIHNGYLPKPKSPGDKDSTKKQDFTFTKGLNQRRMCNWRLKQKVCSTICISFTVEKMQQNSGKIHCRSFFITLYYRNSRGPQQSSGLQYTMHSNISTDFLS